MPFVDGESLRKRLRRQGQLPIAEAVGILREVADALAYAHASGVIHRDVKPDNVLMSGRHAFLADFGVARAVAAQVMSADGGNLGCSSHLTTRHVDLFVVSSRRMDGVSTSRLRMMKVICGPWS